MRVAQHRDAAYLARLARSETDDPAEQEDWARLERKHTMAAESLLLEDGE